MWQNTRLLIYSSLLIIILGLVFLWFGIIRTVDDLVQSPSPVSTPPLIIENSPVATDSAVVGTEGQRVLVTKVIDGDTIEIDNGIKVRLLGIDTPETKDPRKSVQCFGKEAANETKRLIQGKHVILEKDISEIDKYGRLLRFIFLPVDSDKLLFVNDYLIREGFARVLTYPPDVKYVEQFLEAQKEAKENKRGLWYRC